MQIFANYKAFLTFLQSCWYFSFSYFTIPAVYTLHHLCEAGIKRDQISKTENKSLILCCTNKSQCKYLRILKPFLLFCSLAGISRSVTIAAAYIICVTPGLSVSEALQAIRSSRTIANPNFGFQKQLFDFEVNGGVQKVSIICPRVKDASFWLFFCDKVW